MLPMLRTALAMRAFTAMRGMGGMAALRAGIGLITFAGRELALTEAERRAILARLEGALLSRPAAPSEARLNA